MSIKDLRSDLKAQVAYSKNVSGNGVTFGVAIDTAKFDLGTMFTFLANNYTDGNYTFGIQESEDQAFTNPIDVVAPRLIGDPLQNTIAGAQAEGDEAPSLGVFGNLQFVRIKNTAASVTTGSDILVVLHQKPEISPNKASDE